MNKGFFGTNLNIIEYYKSIMSSPVDIIFAALDLVIVVFLIYKLIKISKGKRAMQIFKGIALIFILTIVSAFLKLYILNRILTSIMTYGILALVIIFQPEIRRGLEDLSMSKMARFFGMYTENKNATKEDIYKVVIAAKNLSKAKVGGLIVLEKDITLKEYIDTGVEIDSIVSVPLIENIFVPNTPLHDRCSNYRR